MAASIRRRKCIIGSALVVEIVLFSIVTFVIAYVSSLNAIHHASQQLADSMVDTVAVRVTGYISTAEQSVRNLAVTRRDAMLPEDYGPSSWTTEWMLALRSVLMALNYDAYAFAMQFDDASIVSASTVPEAPWLVLEAIFDARTLPTHGYRTVNVSVWDSRSKKDVTASGDPALADVLVDRDFRTTQAPGYYLSKSLMGVSQPWCVWTPIMLNSPTNSTKPPVFEMCFTCAVIGAGNKFIGELVVVRDISAFTYFLHQVAVTPNTAIFVLDESLFMVAATTSAPTEAIVPANTTEALLPGCVSSRQYNNVTTIRVSCRASVHDYPYEPLQSLAASDLDLLQSPTRRSAYRQLGSMAYYIVYLPIAQPSALRSMRLVLFLPESDVLVDLEQGLSLAIAMCVVLCVVGSLLSSFLVANVVMAHPLRRRGTGHRRATPRMVDLQACYTSLLASWRAFDSATRLMEARARRRLRRALGLPLRRTTTATVSSEAPGACVVLVLQECDPQRVAHPALSLDAIVAEHGGLQSFHTFTDERGGNDDGAASVVRAAVWWVDHPNHALVSDHPELRAVLCALALVKELRLAQCASVTRVCDADTDVLYRCDDNTVIRGAISHLRDAVAAASGGESVVAASRFGVLDRCPSGALVTSDLTMSESCEVLGAAECPPPEVLYTLRRRVHFSRLGAPIDALLRRVSTHALTLSVELGR